MLHMICKTHLTLIRVFSEKRAERALPIFKMNVKSAFDKNNENFVKEGIDLTA